MIQSKPTLDKHINLKNRQYIIQSTNGKVPNYSAAKVKNQTTQQAIR